MNSLLQGVVLCVLWGYGLCYSWECAGLSGDGSYFMYEVVRTGTFHFYWPRAFSDILNEIPLVLALKAGVTDLKWLARVHSFGWFAVPAGLYTAALLRARHDAVLQAAVVAALALVFMTTSFHIVSEHIASYAAALAAAVWLLTSDRLRLADGFFLMAIGIFGLRCYESFVYFGPLLAVLVLWRVRRAISWPSGATTLFALAAALFVVDALASLHAIVTYPDPIYFVAALREARYFPNNPIFTLSLAASGAVVLWGLLRPHDLAGYKPYAVAALAIAAVLLTPLLITPGGSRFGPPYAYSQNVARTAGGLVIVAVMLFMWLHRARWTFRPAAFAVLSSAAVGRRLLVFASVMLVATLPWNVTLLRLYAAYLDAVQEAVDARGGGVVAFEQTRLPDMPWLLQGESWQLPYTSAIVQSDPDDAIIAPPLSWRAQTIYVETALPEDLVNYRWR